jgi:phage shock protein A
MTIAANLPDQYAYLQAENAMLEAENLRLRQRIAALEQHLAHTTTLVNDLMSDDYLHDCGDLLTELSDHVNSAVKGQ